MGKIMKNINKNINKNMSDGNYKVVYDTLKANGYVYTLEEFSHDFSKVDSIKKYCYLLYVMSVEETPEIHLLICDLLMFTDTCFFDIYPVIRWHIVQALKINSQFKNALSWAINIFYHHPDSPFSCEELYHYALLVNSIDPNDSRAKEIIGEHE